MDKLREEFQIKSEIPLFNLIGGYAEEKGYNAVYFKVLRPKIATVDGDFEYKYMYYIHLYKDDEMKLSIYYDKYNLGSMFLECPYFELYDKLNIKRFLDIDEDKIDLFDKVKELI